MSQRANIHAAALLIATFALLCPAYQANAQLIGGRVDAAPCSLAVGGSITASQISNICGTPPEVLDRLVRDATADLQGRIKADEKIIVLLETNLDLNERQIRAALNIIGEAAVPPERIAAKLVEFAESFKLLRASAAAQPGDNSRIAALRPQINTALESGNLQQAERLLADLEKVQTQELNRVTFNIAFTRAQRGEVALSRLSYREAAAHFGAAATGFPTARYDLTLRARERQAEALDRQGAEFGDNDAALAAIDIYRDLLDLRPRSTWPREWAALQIKLGFALLSLGDRESGTARLDEAVSAFREALKELTRGRAPIEWTTVQAYLGQALFVLSERDRDSKRVYEAIAAHREALRELVREREPFRWAWTQSALGKAIGLSGELENSSAHFREAIVIFREVLTVRTREGTPLDWAGTQNDLGNALAELGKRDSDGERLQEALIAYGEGLKEMTRERTPLKWAALYGNQGIALAQLAAQRSDPTMAMQATAQISAAFAVARERGHTFYAAEFEKELREAQAILERLSDAR